MTPDPVAKEARQHAQELVGEAELDAMRALVDAGRERIRRLEELAQERTSLNEGWSKGLAIAVRRAEREAEAVLEAAHEQCAALRRNTEVAAERRASEITAEAERKAHELLQEAEEEARAIVVVTSNERARLLTALERERREVEYIHSRLDSIAVLEAAEQRAAAALEAAEVRCADVLRESEAEARRIVAEAHRTGRERLDEADFEARKIVEAAARRVHAAPTTERTILEEMRKKLGDVLSDALDRIDGAPRRA